MPKVISQALRAWYAALIAFGGGLGAVLVGNADIADVTAGQWVWISLAALTAFGGVYGIVNEKKK